jgi:HSP20 family protein
MSYYKRFQEIQDELERLLDSFTSDAIQLRYGRPQAWQPYTDVYETPTKVIVRLELAGINQDQLQDQLYVRYINNHLIVAGVRSEPLEEERRYFRQVEIKYGRFERIVPIEAEIDPSNIQATYSSGFVVIILPKVEPKSRDTTITITIE